METKETKEFGTVVRISSVDGLYEFLVGQTCPYLKNDPTPFDWAYEDDYKRFLRFIKRNK